MTARKLGRFAGLVFMLAALVGGAAATISAQPSGSSVQAAAAGEVVWD
jgi:hypothetical protein